MCKLKIILCAALMLAVALAVMKYYVSRAPVSNIKQIDSFEQAVAALNATDKNSLVLFDVDDTLIEPASIVLRPQIRENVAYLPWLKELIDKTFKEAKKSEDYYFSIWKTMEVPVLIEPDIVHIIRSLQDRHVKVLALTALRTGADYIIPSLPEWRFNKLKQVGIDFAKADLPDMTFKELPASNAQYPVLYHGLLCTAGVTKDAVLGAFLDRVHWKPNKVVFFDDNMKRVEQVAQEMHKRGIPFQGYQYRGGDLMPGKLDKEVATMQFKHLVEHEEWLIEDQARALLAQQGLSASTAH